MAGVHYEIILSSPLIGIGVKEMVQASTLLKKSRSRRQDPTEAERAQKTNSKYMKICVNKSSRNVKWKAVDSW